MSRVNNGTDLQAKAMGGNTTMTDTGTASSAPSVTTLTDSTKSGSWTTNLWTGQVVVSGNVAGVILSNTTTVLTIDLWHSTSSWGSATPGTTPSNGATYVIIPGAAPAVFIGNSVATLTIAAAHAFLTNDASTVSEAWASGGGLNRAIAAWTHTTAVASYTLTKQFTSNSNDGAALTLNRIGVFAANVTAAPSTTTSGPMLFETNLSNVATLVPSQGDQITVTESISI